MEESVLPSQLQWPHQPVEFGGNEGRYNTCVLSSKNGTYFVAASVVWSWVLLQQWLHQPDNDKQKERHFAMWMFCKIDSLPVACLARMQGEGMAPCRQFNTACLACAHVVFSFLSLGSRRATSSATLIVELQSGI